MKRYVQLPKGFGGRGGEDGQVSVALRETGQPLRREHPNAGRERRLHLLRFGRHRAVKLKAKDGSFEPEQVYFESKLPTAIGGAVKIGGFLYGTTPQAMLCLEFATGKVTWEERALGAASLCYADGRLYLHGENGDVALVETSPESYREKGRFTPPDQPKHSGSMEKAWAYPVVANGQLYIRDHSTLWCYDVRALRNRASSTRPRHHGNVAQTR